ncbi:hypothetical protein IAQ61_007303, partial [Plenodomus lingam]|uniref:uncharacterized protein n=1 Tax=Leptosphaeria maculans TaxID=5022 RepID=UPI003317B3F6
MRLTITASCALLIANSAHALNMACKCSGEIAPIHAIREYTEQCCTTRAISFPNGEAHLGIWDIVTKQCRFRLPETKMSLADGSAGFSRCCGVTGGSCE